MNELDLSEVDPLKWAEVRRRVAAVTKYLDLPCPTAADREHFARSLGLGPQQFSNLVKAWKIHREATALSPSSGRRHGSSRSKAGGVDPRAREIAREAIAGIGTGATIAKLSERIEAACRKERVPPPSKSTIWLLVVEARNAANHAQGELGVLLAHAFLRVPVKQGRSITFPRALFAVDVASGRIITAMLETKSDADLSAFSRQVVADEALRWGPLLAREAWLDDLKPHLPAGTQLIGLPRKRPEKELSALLGNNIGRLGLSYRSPTVRPSTVMQSGRDEPLGHDDAKLALQIACARHNRDLSLQSWAA